MTMELRQAMAALDQISIGRPTAMNYWLEEAAKVADAYRSAIDPKSSNAAGADEAAKDIAELLRSFKTERPGESA
jgi:hypothetical protein